MANQLDYVCKQLKPRNLDTSVRDFLDWIISSGKTHPISGPYLLVAAHVKGPGRRKLMLFACLPSPSLASLPNLTLRQASLHWNQNLLLWTPM